MNNVVTLYIDLMSSQHQAAFTALVELYYEHEFKQMSHLKS